MRLLLLIATVIAVLGFILVIGGLLAAPNPQICGDPPEDLSAVSIYPENGPPIAGWFIQGKQQQGGVLLLHSIRSNRREMIGRARFLRDAGYTVLMIDMQAHGETPGTNITFGYLESRDVHNAINYLRSRIPNQPIGVIGVSLGGAAALLGKEPINADAVVLEAVYSDIKRALENRLVIRFGAYGKYLAPLLVWQIQPRLNISTEKLAPVSAISRLKSPVMIVTGSDDQHTVLAESKALFTEASEPKYFWVLEGAIHENLHQYSPKEYERRILAFFQKYLRSSKINLGLLAKSFEEKAS
ncbi:hypothetical protein PN36_20480 [Candidatus Thiomargarita nelsonii]|uniref:Serine aminopeptidase S33 domain-containing protein n=1 Tax=Candidatus Thiomargarita nelsonii TaxID=1003181 RepID=A0A4E0QNR2_9GAMM|nr:hypothetical protein PN36_20480 [Candidatus Thiomargarita nelsonii]